MSLAMTLSERESFLAELHVGVVSIGRDDAGPLTVPIWYDYEPGGDAWMLIGATSRKAKAIKAGDRFSLVAQNEGMPYSYVSVEGVAELRAPKEGEMLNMAIRYLGESQGKAYASQSSGENHVLVMKIERWLTVDYGKLG